MNRIIAVVLIGLGIFNLISMGMQYNTLRALQAENAYVPSPKQEQREKMLELRKRSLLSPWNDLGMMRAAYLSPDALQEKLALNTVLLKTWPSADNAFRQSVLLAIAGRNEEAMRMWKLAVHAYPGARGEVVKLLDQMRIGLPDLAWFIDWAGK